MKNKELGNWLKRQIEYIKENIKEQAEALPEQIDAWKESDEQAYKQLESLIQQSGEKPEISMLQEVKDFNEEWTNKDWIQWAFKLGHHLDNWIPWCGVDNRKRIEDAILDWKKLKERKIEKKPEIDEKFIEQWADKLTQYIISIKLPEFKEFDTNEDFIRQIVAEVKK